jgi:hypothetical protein
VRGAALVAAAASSVAAAASRSAPRSSDCDHTGVVADFLDAVPLSVAMELAIASRPYLPSDDVTRGASDAASCTDSDARGQKSTRH